MEVYSYDCLWCALSQSIICQPEIKPGPVLPVKNVSLFRFYYFFYLHGIVSTKAVNIMDYYLETHV